MIRANYSRTPDEYGFWKSSVLVDRTTSDYVILTSEMRRVMVAIHPIGGATARAEFTFSSLDSIEASTAKWIPWIPSTVEVSTASEIPFPATAVRAVSTGGSATFEFCAI